MIKRLASLFLLLACIFSISSCALVPVYDAVDLVTVLEGYGYEVETVSGEDIREGITGYIYGYKTSSGDEIYYIYCEDVRSAKYIYDYVNSRRKAKIAELKMEIEKIEYALYKAEDVSAAEKGDYYERFVEKSEDLEKIQGYSCGHGLNVVWYGTKKAIQDIRKG